MTKVVYEKKTMDVTKREIEFVVEIRRHNVGPYPNIEFKQIHWELTYFTNIAKPLGQSMHEISK